MLPDASTEKVVPETEVLPDQELLSDHLPTQFQKQRKLSQKDSKKQFKVQTVIFQIPYFDWGDIVHSGCFHHYCYAAILW